MILSSLYAKLAIALLALLLLVGISFVFLSQYTTGMYEQEVTQRLNIDLARFIVSEKLVLKDRKVDKAALDEIFHMLMVINPKIEVYLLDTDGRILAFSAEPGKVRRETVDTGPIRRFLSGGSVLPLFGDDPRDPSGKKVFTAARITEGGELEGYLYVILGGELYDSVMQKLQGSYIFRLGLWGIVSSVAVAVFGGLAVFALLTRRLRRLTSAMNNYTEGISLDALGLPAEKDAGSGDEIDRLLVTFRSMASRIEQQLGALRSADSLRRELIANVSHDLRTPLATMQGYMETLLMKDTALTAETKHAYLETALQHCKRLNKLVSDLFELAKLEAMDTVLHSEPFNLSELVQDAVQKFLLRAQEEGVVIHANISSELPFVYADIALVERVIENLLDNALRFITGGGSISVYLDDLGKFVSVRVSDTGVGIPQTELPRIFDRLYQVDRSRRDASGHSGLGLAVTRRIIELHGGTVTVESTVNAGTTFSFTLPVYAPDNEDSSATDDR